MPNDELYVKLALCHHLGLIPLFVARQRHAGQWMEMNDHGGLLFVFKTKVLPPGQEQLAKEMWEQARLPVAVWHDWAGRFYPVVGDFIAQTDA